MFHTNEPPISACFVTGNSSLCSDDGPISLSLRATGGAVYVTASCREEGI